MPKRIPILVLVALLLVLGARRLAPPPASVAGAFGRGPTVVIVHGLGSGAAHWLPAGRELARRHRVVLVDLPGHGQSAMPEPFSLERARAALHGALARERAPFVLVGHSLGGLVCAAEALERPDRVLGLVLVETALKPQVEGEERRAALEALESDWRPLVAAAFRSFGRDSAQGAALAAGAARLDAATVRPWVRLAFTADLSRRAEGLEVPVLAVLAERSWPAREPWDDAAAALGYARVPHVEPVRFEDCGHFVMLDRPAELAALIERFASAPPVPVVAMR